MNQNEKLSQANIHQQLEQKLKLVPKLPGVYLMRNAEETIIYVGKAKNLHNRVRSYFRGAHDGKTMLLIAEITDFETIVTNSDKEALILEINLIQEYKPQYNIRLKDGTMYPYLKITNEKDPQLIITNEVKKDGAHYFGPFPNVGAATNTQQVLHRAYPLRRCNRNESRACFYYHLDQCIGPCDHEVSKEEYEQQIKKIRRFFNGDTKEIQDDLTHKMLKASENLDFEKAADYRDQINYIQMTVEKQNVMSHDYDQMDVFAYTLKRGWLSVQVFILRQGSILKREAAIFPSHSAPEDEVATFIARFYLEQAHLMPRTILVPADIDHEILKAVLNVEVTTPIRGRRKRMLDLCQKNSQIALDEKFRMMEMNEQRTTKAVKELAELLQIPQANYIESFDHSNISGVHSVSGMVVYKAGKEDRSSYRKFKIKTVEGSDEFAYTQEVIRRRYTRLLREQRPLPDLILMDGGIIQVRAARDVLENELGLTIPVAGMVKDERHQTAALLDGYSEKIIDIERRSPAFHFIQRVQEEVHRYAIDYHRQVRSRSTFGSILDDIPGVGPVIRKRLLQHFRTINRIKNADIEEFRRLNVPRPTAKRILDHLNADDSIPVEREDTQLEKNSK